MFNLHVVPNIHNFCGLGPYFLGKLHWCGLDLVFVWVNHSFSRLLWATVFGGFQPCARVKQPQFWRVKSLDWLSAPFFWGDSSYSAEAERYATWMYVGMAACRICRALAIYLLNNQCLFKVCFVCSCMCFKYDHNIYIYIHVNICIYIYIYICFVWMAGSIFTGRKVLV